MVVPHVIFEITVKQPQTTRTPSGAVLVVWLARPGKDAGEQALKERRRELIRGEAS